MGRMKINFTSAVFVVCLCALAANAAAQEGADPNCSVDVMLSTPQVAIDACTAVLDKKSSVTQAVTAAALKTRGRAFYSIHRLEPAAADFQLAMLLDPNDPDMPVRSGWIALGKGEFEQVAAFASKALVIDHHFGRAYDLVGAMMGRLGQYDAAIEAYDKAIEVSPGDPQPHLSRFKTLVAAHRQKEALREADIMLALPGPELSKPNVISYDTMVVTSFRTAIALGRADLLTKLGRDAEATAAYQKAVDNDPSALTYTWRAYDNLNNDAAEAVVLADIQKALSLSPNYWYAHIIRGRVDFQAKRYEAAATEFSRAAAFAPKIGIARWWNAQGLRRIGRVETATDEALAAMEVEPNFIFSKLDELHELGYLADTPPEPWQSPIVQDAVRACMLDERCW
jgi:tetratricopeptide (TPR) repeat protein